MEKFADLPDSPNKQPANSLPFDIDQYICKQLTEAKDCWQKIYKDEHVELKLTELMKNLDYEKRVYKTAFDYLITEFRKGSRVIDLISYSQEIDKMKAHALNNFYYILLTKGYSYQEKEVISTFNDFMDGLSTKCTKVITIK
ncbi:MAG: hypothetical protein Barrevirus34_5 [Barrevirus sp.]|uniref:Uncharacterized protein n=1 Tax=Barrevirus sp. TaxID=2487763 RepID=A0A3G4ZQY5_9VIRU|nr:MAG: hypothetical protein Barrevirus34_5 [Barrevirus sp.]